ncbi:MAG: hypothetical protein ACXWLH_01995 [Candidatus Saccharimonadales bacterium]
MLNEAQQPKTEPASIQSRVRWYEAGEQGTLRLDSKNLIFLNKDNKELLRLPTSEIKKAYSRNPKIGKQELYIDTNNEQYKHLIFGILDSIELKLIGINKEQTVNDQQNFSQWIIVFKQLGIKTGLYISPLLSTLITFAIALLIYLVGRGLNSKYHLGF